MNDIRVTKQGNHVLIEGVSADGQNWLEDNIYHFDKLKIHISIPIEFYQEFVNELYKAELIVEER